MSDPFSTFASALEQYVKVRHIGRGTLRACCPVCGEKSVNTLSAKLADSGGVLVKCFKDGCSVEQIVTAIGLTLTDLFPPREREDGKPFSKPRRVGLLPMSQMLDLLETETLVILVASENLSNGHTLTDADRERLRDAAGRVQFLIDEARK